MPEDREIIALFFARSEKAIAALAEKYGAVCLRIANNILGDPRDSEECVNDAYLGAWNTIPPQEPEPLLSYICRIVRNLSVKRYHAITARKRNSRYDISLDELENCFPSADCPEKAWAAKETRNAINLFLETLDQENRVLFVRRYFHADSIEELAALFHTSKHNISVRLSRTREKLKKYLTDAGVTI